MWVYMLLTSAILTVLSLVGVETFHVIVKLLLTRLLEPDLQGRTKHTTVSKPRYREQIHFDATRN